MESQRNVTKIAGALSSFGLALCLIFVTSVATATSDDSEDLLSRDLSDKAYEFGVYLGNDPDMLYRLTVFEKVVIDTSEFSKDEISILRNSGTKVYAEISISTAQKGTSVHEKKKSARLKKVPQTLTNTYYMDPSKKNWRNFVVNTRVKSAEKKEVDGFYLTGADVYDSVGKKNKSDVAAGVFRTIIEIDKKYPKKKIIVEDPLGAFGDDVITREQILRHVDAISKTELNYKPNYSASDDGQDTYQQQTSKKRQSWVKKLKTYKRKGIKIYTIDFTQKKSNKEIAETRARKNGFTSFVGTRDLDNVLWYGGQTSSFVTRPFTEDSIWNTPIDDNPKIEEKSDLMIDTIEDGYSLGRLFLNVEQWTVPIYYADNSTPTYVVDCTSGCGPGFTGSLGYETAAMPIPDNAEPDDTSDGLMTVVNVETGYSYDYFQAEKKGKNWTTAGGFRFDLSDDGVQEISATSTGARGAGFPLMAGLVHRDEILQGHIPHALVMAVDYPKAGSFVWPASAEDGRSEENYAIPEGARIQLNPDLDVDSLGLNRTGTIIARALQEYGAFIGDNSDGLSIYVEGRYAKSPEWENDATGEESIISMEDINDIPLDQLRVLEMGELLTNPYLK
ncbi:MAG: hypothetical protein COW24_01185 [Candidatus Kerfeldbacteria bacterium CG15_BIG_FIL_POST_REV_8_21_14_020_45_12]|uniref:Glycoside-hydrolase family GH114 TIM-barrel domain-containing protein n=1 Tax=Candidatus Kerfeldbacteria bacterium CG15_BIG_FIL_POST_REV_8_21_14_020_45_12 TaxID=2014247 RepID=A0A2M7H4U2_9BACT|nr:MAG: hypothetical protein COW24_01185 [Candidatus Kerfeldbacteria bacterium CG15_BIG_FIL_POST_REV_8_21_14_020_45_12]PJA93891.1 MAG: hypothetical protein CO132_00885 [Candidatus Kerfeldbacteria bacterium CG_4_9_14_3_um_filter_45_8]